MIPKIDLVSSCPFEGGAARAAFRLHEALREAGALARWIDAGGGAPERPDLVRLTRPDRRKRGLWARLTGQGDWRRFQRPFVGAHTYATWPRSWGDAKALGRTGASPDLYHLHWVGDFLDWPTALPFLSKRAPLVWTLHDLNPTQGVWHYDPASDERTPARDLLDARARETKAGALRALPESRLTFVAPSRWMAERCRASELTGRFRVELIPNGVDPGVFRPVDKVAARAGLGLPSDCAVLGFIADTLGDRRKGMAVLEEAIHRLAAAGRRVILLTVGNGEVRAPAGVEAVSLGSVRRERLLSLFYSACDVFVCPSLQDNLPNTVLEAMACGTAVAGSRTGGIVDMITEGENGWLAEPGDAEALARAISGALANAEALAEAGRRARARVLADFTVRLQADRHLALYRELAGGRAG